MIGKSMVSFNSDDRGQLLLLAAVAIVIIILGTVTLLNSAAFTELQRSDGITDRSDQTFQQLADVETGIEQAIEHANHEDDTTRVADVQTDIAVLETRLNNQFGSQSGQINLGDVNGSDVTNGTRIWKPQNGENFTSSDSTGTLTDYTVVNNSDSVRSFTLGIDSNSLRSPSASDPFTVTVDGDSIYLFENASGTEIYVTNSTSPSPADAGTCTISTDPNEHVEIGFSQGTVNGKTCTILPGREDISSIGFENADGAEGSMDAVVTGGNTLPDSSTPTVDHPSDYTTGNTPSGLRSHDAIYSVVVDVTITSPTSDLTTTLRVAPQLPSHAADRGGS